MEPWLVLTGDREHIRRKLLPGIERTRERIVEVDSGTAAEPARVHAAAAVMSVLYSVSLQAKRWIDGVRPNRRAQLTLSLEDRYLLHRMGEQIDAAAAISGVRWQPRFDRPPPPATRLLLTLPQLAAVAELDLDLLAWRTDDASYDLEFKTGTLLSHLSDRQFGDQVLRRSPAVRAAALDVVTRMLRTPSMWPGQCVVSTCLGYLALHVELAGSESRSKLSPDVAEHTYRVGGFVAAAFVAALEAVEAALDVDLTQHPLHRSYRRP